MERKKFLQLAGSSLGILALDNYANASSFLFDENAAAIKNFGVQLWSVRDAMAKDPKGTIIALAKYGYKTIESCELEKGILWGIPPKDMKMLLADNGLKMKATHINMFEKFEEKAVLAAELGLEYMIYPWEGPAKTIDDYKKLAEDLNKKGEYLKKMGMRTAFHNHDFTFKKLEGEFAQDVLMKNTQADLVDFEMDIYWVVTAGQDPVEWIKRYPNRFKSCHIKDRMKNVLATETNASCVLGTGVIDFKKILKAAKQNGMKHYFVEQERYDAGSSLECVGLNAGYMKKIRI